MLPQRGAPGDSRNIRGRARGRVRAPMDNPDLESEESLPRSPTPMMARRGLPEVKQQETNEERVGLAAEASDDRPPRGTTRGVRLQEHSGGDTRRGSRGGRGQQHSLSGRGKKWLPPGCHPDDQTEDSRDDDEEEDEGETKSRSSGKDSVESSYVKIGRPLHIVTNHFELRWVGEDSKEFQVHQYHVDFEPEDAQPNVRRRMLNAGSQIFGAPFVFDGGNEFYCGKKFTEDRRILEMEPLEDLPDTKYTACLVYTKTLPESDPIYMQMYNLIVKKCLYGMGLDEIGQSYFDTEAIVEYPQLKVQIWPGYSASMKECEKGLLLCVDVTHKVVRSDQLLTTINGLMNAHRRGVTKPLGDYIMDEIKGSVVITSYNKLSYRVDGILLDMNPMSKFTLKDGSEISFLEYYQTRYHIDISDHEQPLISASMTKRTGKNAKDLLLIPELCCLTGLTDTMRANMKVMKELGKHLHVEPHKRFEKIQKFMTRLGGNSKCKKVLDDWGFAFEPKLMECTVGRVLPSEILFFGGNKMVKADEKNDWTRALRSNELVSCVDLNKWVVIVCKRDVTAARDFVKTMIKVASPLGFKISEPINFEKVEDARVPEYLRTLDRILKLQQEHLQMVMCVLPTNGADLYNAVKKRLTQDIGSMLSCLVQSQCLLQRNLHSKSAMSIATKLVVQMCTKLGGEPWSLLLPPTLKRKTVSIGFDIQKKKGANRGSKVCSLVSTMSEKHSRYFSVVFSCNDQDEMEQQLHQGVIKCVEAFAMANEMNVPTSVIFYRCGADDGMLTSGLVPKEADKIEETLGKWYEFQEVKKHRFAYILVTKQTNTKMMSHKGKCAESPVTPDMLQNPPPGTIVDMDFVERDGKYKEFFLVPSVARQGTVRPVQYRILKDTFNLNADVLQLYTYKMCHLYYNWTGTVNLPSVCQYAGKLVQQTAQAFPNNQPHDRLSKYLHFL